MLYLDALTSWLKQVEWETTNSSLFYADNESHHGNSSTASSSSSSRRYDAFVVRDGLTDHRHSSSSTSTASSSGADTAASIATAINTLCGVASADSASSAMQQQQQQQQQQRANALVDDAVAIDTALRRHSNTITLREQLEALYELASTLFNNGRAITICDWHSHGALKTPPHHSPATHSMNKFAHAMMRSTSSAALSVDYRPYLHQMCVYEEKKVRTEPSKRNRRAPVHHLGHLSIGLTRDDYPLLAKSTFAEQLLATRPHHSPRTAEAIVTYDTTLYTHE